MIKKFTLPLVILILICKLSQAQINFSVIGKAKLNNQILNNWSIFLLKNSDSTVIKTSITNHEGEFVFKNINQGSYLVATQSITSKNKLYYPITILDKDLNLNEVNYIGKSNYLNEVKVASYQSYLDIKNGKISVELENSPFGLGSTGFEVLQTLPGIRIRNENEISVNGKNNVALYINNKPSNLSGENLINYIKNLNTSGIAKIEIVDQLSAKYDAANNGGIINIILKRGENIGSNTILNAGGGLGLNYRFNGGINYTMRTTKSSMFLNYDYNKLKALDQVDLNRTIGVSNTNFIVENNDVKTRNNNNLLFGFNHDIDSLQSVGILLNVFSNNFISDEQNKSNIFSRIGLDSTINTQSFEKRKVYNVSGNLNFNKKIKNSSAYLKSDIDILMYERQSDEKLLSNYLNSNGSNYKAPLIFNNQTPAYIRILTGKIDYTNSINKGIELSMGLKASFVNTKSDRKIDITSGQEYINNPNAIFNYTEQVYAGYLNLAKQLTKQSSLEFGLRAEQTIANGDTSQITRIIERRYLNLFPSISYQNKIDENNTFNFSILRGINRPKYEELNPFFYFLDEFNFRQGNPQLDPSYLYTTKLEWLFKNKYATTVRYNYNRDFTYNVFEQDDVQNNITTYLANFNYRQTLGISFNIPIKVAKWYNLNFNSEANLEFFKFTDKQNNVNENNSGSFALILNHDLRLPKNIRAGINMVYESPTAYGIFTFKSLYYNNLALSKAILKNKGSLRLIVTDPFNTNANRFSSTAFNLNLNGREKAETRSFRLNFSYKFGKTTLKNIEKRKLGSDEEKSRVNL